MLQISCKQVKWWGVVRYMGFTLPICLSVVLSVCLILSTQICSNCSTIFFFFNTKLGMMVYYHEVMCHAEKWVHCLQFVPQKNGIPAFKVKVTVKVQIC